MKVVFRPKLFAAFVLVCAVFGLALSYFTGISYWWAAAMAGGGILANGVLAEVEDRSIGGLLHHHKQAKEPHEPTAERDA